MIVKVNKKHTNSKNCFVCGTENKESLKVDFFEVETKEMVAVYFSNDSHISYPGRVHGGISASLLDETIGRAITCLEPDAFGVTIDFQIRYKKPVPVDQIILIVGKITRNKSRLFEGEGYILLKDKTVAAIAKGRYMKMDVNKIAGEGIMNEELVLVSKPNDPKSFNILEEFSYESN
ncbi:MAG: PaaI family thioesterase [Erysipelotrichales bacterium]|nr:PaaI family thioesterase [Erysipelotrichales bacterium]